MFEEALRGFFFYHGRMAKKKAHKRVKLTADQVVMPRSATYDVVVVGGGAAGLAAAISAAQTAKQASASLSILVLEQGRRIGASIMRSGNGRCNFSNAQLEVSRFWNADFVRSAFQSFDNNEDLPSVSDWFSALGLVYSEMPGSGGLLYPASRKADSVLVVLQHALDDLGIEVCPNLRVTRIARSGGEIPERRITVNTENALAEPGAVGLEIGCSQLIFAVGGTYADLFDSRGIRLVEVPRRPVLAPLQVKSAGPVDWESLDGIRVNARVSVPAAGFSEVGEVLFREYGISGIVVFNASRAAEQGQTVELDFVPDLDEAQLADLLTKRVDCLGARTADDFFDGFLLRPVAQAVLAQAGVSADGPLSAGCIDAIVRTMKHFELAVEGIAEPKSAQVQRGGIDVCDVDPATFCLNDCSEIHVVGEALDVDGPCGGYNLHWAWTSGIAAGHAAACAVCEGGKA